MAVGSKKNSAVALIGDYLWGCLVSSCVRNEIALLFIGVS